MFDLCLGVEKKILKEKYIIIIHYLTYVVTPQHKNLCPGGLEIYNFNRSFLGYQHYKLNLSDLCLRVKRKILNEIMHYNLVDSSLVNITLSLFHLCLGLDKSILKEIMDFRYMAHCFTLAHHYLVCLNHAPEKTRRFLKK